MKSSTKLPSFYLHMGYVSYSDTSSFKISDVRRNELDELTLLKLLDSLQGKLFLRRRRRTTLIVHGGVVDVLAHKCRRFTSDIDYIERVLPEELESISNPSLISRLLETLGFCKAAPDTRTILRDCIHATAAEFNDNSIRAFDLDHNWMNAGADIVLPWRLDEQCNAYDPLVASAVSANEDASHIIYDSPGLRLIAITSSWTFALKFQRFSDADEADLVNFFQEDGVCAVHTEDEFVQMVEDRMQTDCKEMDYALWTKMELEEWRGKIMQCVKKARFLGQSRPLLL